MNNIPGKQSKVLLIGRGISTDAAFKLLTNQFGVKEQNIFYIENTEDQLPPENFDLSILSPGFPRSSEIFKKTLKKLGEAKILNEIDLGFLFLKQKNIVPKNIVGITGSSGKSTVASLACHGLLSDQKKAALVGNFGLPLCELILKNLDNQVEMPEYLVVELSSYQLESLKKIELDYSIITSLSPNHVDRYNSVSDYYNTKFRIIDLTKNISLLNSESKDLVDFVEMKNLSSNDFSWANRRVWGGQKLIGVHNQHNLNLVADLFDHLGLGDTAYESLMSYTGLPHRLEFVVEKNGVCYFNDSKATSIDAVKRALEAIHLEYFLHKQEGPTLHLLLGGKDKALPWSQLSILKNLEFVQSYFFGEVAQVAKSQLEIEGQSYQTLEEALRAAAAATSSGDVVLLSPGGSSLDQYKNFEERGDHFKKIVSEL